MTRLLGVVERPGDAGELAAFAESIKAGIDLVAFGDAASAVDSVAPYADKTYKLASSRPEHLYSSLKRLFEEGGYQLIIGHSLKNLRDALSRLAGSLDLPMTTDAIKASIEGSHVIVERGTLSERVVSKMRMPLPAIVLFNPKFTEPAKAGSKGEVIELEPDDGYEIRVLGVTAKSTGAGDIEAAEIVVGVGRGFKSKDDLKLAFELAEALGAQVGCTRPIAADLRWLPEDCWIGISGKRIAPKLYIAIGVSGSPQHMSGVQNAKVIVAINSDESAPIFSQADYGVVADLYQFLPVLIGKLRQRLG